MPKSEVRPGALHSCRDYLGSRRRPGAPCLRSEWHEGGGRGYRFPRKRSALSLLRGRLDNSPGARTSAEPELPSGAEQHFRLTCP